MNENPEDEEVLDLPELLIDDINIAKTNANTTSKKSPAKKNETRSESEEEFEVSEVSSNQEEIEESSFR